MKKIALILFVVGFCVSGIKGQSKYGKVTQDELEMTSYPEDTTASALVLYKNGRLNFVYNDERGFLFEYSLEMKIKILKTEGLQYADDQISYYEIDRLRKEEVLKLSGTTYNLEDGKIVKTKLSGDNIFEEELDEKWKRKKFAMPAVKVGSVIEYKYTLVSSFLYELRDFYFQSSIPIDYVNFEATIPEYFRYNLEQQGYVILENSEKKPTHANFTVRYYDDNGRIQIGTHSCIADEYTFRSTKVPAAKPETQLWALNDYISKVSFELKSTNFPGSFTKTYANTWSNIDKDLLQSSGFGANLKRSGWFKDMVSVGEPSLGRASEILNLVKGKVKWNDKNSLYSYNLKEALNKGVGSSSDLNFLLINALNAAGMEAYPIILSTRGNGRLPISHPSASGFNYVIVALRLDNNMYFTDAASKYGSWNILPEKCMVESARLLSENHKDWIDLTTVSTGSTFRQVDVSFGDDKILAKITETRTGNDAYDFRSAFYSHENKDKFIEAAETRNNSIIEDVVMDGIDDNSAQAKITLVDKRDLELDGETDFFYYRPPLSKIYTVNPFTAETRTYPINFDYLRNYVQLINITIPEGYQVAELPKSERMRFNDNDIVYTYHMIEENNLIKIAIRFQVKKLLFLPSDYASLKEFFGKMLLKNDEPIVLKKAESINPETEQNEEVSI